MKRRGILLAGGSGTRLYPVSLAVNKHLVPVYDKPLIYYSLSTLMLAGVREILVVTARADRPAFERLLGGGEAWGMQIEYAIQDRPEGIAQALTLGEAFLQGGPCLLVLGDNVFHGTELQKRLKSLCQEPVGATIFAYQVRNPSAYAVIDLDPEGRPRSLEEKPANPRSSLAVPGLYFLDGRAPAFARAATPSARGELEITSVLQRYLDAGELRVEPLGRGSAWLDAGTFEQLIQAAQFVEVVQSRQGVMIACPEEIAWRQGWIADARLAEIAGGLPQTAYRQYLSSLLDTR